MPPPATPSRQGLPKGQRAPLPTERPALLPRLRDRLPVLHAAYLEPS